MSFPNLGYLGLKTYTGMAPHWLAQDPDNGYALAWTIYALTSPVESLITIMQDGDDGSPGWSAAVDVDRTPDEWLDWLGQFVGVTPGGDAPLPLILLASNLLVNPSFETDRSRSLPRGWTIAEIEAGSTRLSEVNNTWAAVDVQSYRWRGVTTRTNGGVALTSGRLSLTADNPLYFKATVRVDAGAIVTTATVNWYDSSGTLITSQSRTAATITAITNSPVALAFDPAPNLTSYATLVVRLVNATASTIDTAIDALILSTGDVAYFDGTDYLASWAGAEGASISNLYAPDPTQLVDSRRVKIKDASNLRRGTLPALRATAQKRLVGTRKTLITEGYNGSPWKVHITTFRSETPNPAGTAADLESIRMAGYLFYYETFYGQTYEQLRAQYGPTWRDVGVAFDTWDDVRKNIPA